MSADQGRTTDMNKFKTGDRVVAASPLAGVAQGTAGSICAVWTNPDTNETEKVSVKWDTGVKTVGLIQWRSLLGHLGRTPT